MNSSRATGRNVRGQSDSRGQREAIRRGRPYKAQQLRRLRADTPSPTSAYFKRKRQEEEEKEGSRKEEQEKARRIGPSPPQEARRTRTASGRDLSLGNQETLATEPEEGRNKAVGEAADMEAAKHFEELKKLISGIREDLKKDNEQTRNEIRELKDELYKKEQVWKQEKDEINKEVKALKNRMKEKDDTINWLLSKEEDRDRKERKNNIVISGWKAPGNESLTIEVAEFLKSRLNSDVGVEEARGIGGKGERKKLVVAKLYSWDDKQEIMRKKKNLKQARHGGSEEGEEEIFIDHDRTFKEREARRIIHRRATEEKKKGKTTKEGYMKLTIDGTTWNWNENTGQLEEEKRQGNFRE